MFQNNGSRHASTGRPLAWGSLEEQVFKEQSKHPLKSPWRHLARCTHRKTQVSQGPETGDAGISVKSKQRQKTPRSHLPPRQMASLMHFVVMFSESHLGEVLADRGGRSSGCCLLHGFRTTRPLATIPACGRSGRESCTPPGRPMSVTGERVQAASTALIGRSQVRKQTCML